MISVEEPKTNKRETHQKNSSSTDRGTKTISQQIDEFKFQLEEAGKQAKENIRETINVCTGQYTRAIEANKEYVNELREQMKTNQVNTSSLDEISSAFTDFLQLSEKVIDTIIDSYLHRMNQMVDFNKKSAEQLYQSYINDNFNYEKFIALQQKNLEQGIELSTRDMKQIVEVYNTHINLSVNFSKKFSQNINLQIDALVKFQKKGLHAYNSWIADWYEKDK